MSLSSCTFLPFILQFEVKHPAKNFKNQNQNLLLFIFSTDFDKKANNVMVQKSTSPYSFLKFGKNLSNWPNLAPQIPILDENHRNLSPAAYG